MVIGRYGDKMQCGDWIKCFWTKQAISRAHQSKQIIYCESHRGLITSIDGNDNNNMNTKIMSDCVSSCCRLPRVRSMFISVLTLIRRPPNGHYKFVCKYLTARVFIFLVHVPATHNRPYWTPNFILITQRSQWTGQFDRNLSLNTSKRGK